MYSWLFAGTSKDVPSNSRNLSDIWDMKHTYKAGITGMFQVVPGPLDPRGHLGQSGEILDILLEVITL